MIRNRSGFLLHSDGYGYQPYTDEKITQLLDQGKINGISILSNMIRGRSAKMLPHLAKLRGHTRIGLQINLTEGKSLENRTDVRSLAWKKGAFYPFWIFFPLLMGKFIRLKDIRLEIDSQIKLLLNAGICPDMIDSHDHLHALSPIAEIVCEKAAQYGIPHVRSYNNVRTFTLAAKVKYLLLKYLAVFSHMLYYRKWGLPKTWELSNEEKWTFLGWEGESFDIGKQKHKNIVFVIRPFLPFDTNTSYVKLF